MEGRTKVKSIEDIKKEFELGGYTLLTTEYKNQHQRLDYVCPNSHERHTTWKDWKKGNRCLMCKNQRTKLSIDQIKESFVREGYTLLSKEYINNKTKLEYLCPMGHKNSMTWADWNSGGYRCPDCANNKKLSIDKINSDFNAEGYTFVSGEYKNNTSKLILKCSKGHEFETSRVSWTSGSRCPTCYSDRINIDVVRESFSTQGYTLLSDSYIDAHTKLDYICDKGHRHSISWVAWQQGQRCYYCRNDNSRVSLEEVKGRFTSEGYKFIESSYTKDKLEYVCPEGHKGSTTLQNWYLGARCPHCYGNAKLSFEYVKEQIEQEGYKVITKELEYKNNRTKLHLICPNKHDYFASWFDWHANKVRCYKCKEKGTSLQENALLEHVKTLITKFEVHDRYLISPKELDIIIKDKKVAIEYCGLYWHSELMGKNNSYHLNKLNKCNSKEYSLVTIFEDEWVNKRSIVESRLKGILGKTENTIYARKTEAREVSTQEARRFCEANHLQGYTGSRMKLGLFYEGELVSVMTFATPSLAKGAKGKKEGAWELSRFCSKLNTSVVGGASKLLTYFKKNYEWVEIFSYADRRWSIGNLYEKLGFDLVGETAPNYWYFKPGQINRTHRFALRKKPDEPKDITEWELRKEQGYNRIWDCGNLKYVMHK